VADALDFLTILRATDLLAENPLRVHLGILRKSLRAAHREAAAVDADEDKAEDARKAATLRRRRHLARNRNGAPSPTPSVVEWRGFGTESNAEEGSEDAEGEVEGGEEEVEGGGEQVEDAE
jgi:hypothetical protein